MTCSEEAFSLEKPPTVEELHCQSCGFTLYSLHFGQGNSIPGILQDPRPENAFKILNISSWMAVHFSPINNSLQKLPCSQDMVPKSVRGISIISILVSLLDILIHGNLDASFSLWGNGTSGLVGRDVRATPDFMVLQ